MGWTAFAFAGVYLWTLWLPVILCAVLAILAARSADPARDVRLVEVLLLILAGGIAVQAVPLPAAIGDVLSSADRLTRQRLSLRVPSSLPLTIDRASTLWAGLIAAMTIVTFTTAVRLLHSGGIAVCGST